MTLALWCLLFAGVLPILTVGPAKWSDRGFDNSDPRGWAGQLAGWRKRAVAAQNNGFEVFPFFAAAVLTATVQEADVLIVDLLAVIFVLTRLAYAAAYLANWPTTRSLCFGAGYAAAIAIFTAPAWT